MSAILCGKKRSFFGDIPSSTLTTPVSKKLRCSSSPSPARFSPRRSTLVEKLSELFPLMDHQLLEQALEECGHDIDAAIKRLNELCLGSSEENGGPANNGEANVDQGGVAANEQQPGPAEDPAVQNALPADGAQWVELFVREMMSATSVDDARTRASRMLEVLEKSISSRAVVEAADNHQKENLVLKEQIQVLIGENTILKRLVQKQHERQKEYEDQVQEAQHLKQLIPQYQEQLRNLEVRNYTLTMHLKQAEQSNSIPGRFHPDVF